ncbi:MAG: hypothetical protein WAZ48_07020 [Lysobacteraceae bacterium]
MRAATVVCLSLILSSVAAHAAQTAVAQPHAAHLPEIQREPFPPQAPGKVHTIRIIPEVCAYLQGSFAVDAAAPYRYGAMRTGKRCQPRARLVDPAKANPSVETGWVLNDLIRIPNAGCPARQAVIRIWRKPTNNAPQLDGEGRPRIYLEDAKRQAAAGKIPALPQYAAVLTMEGRACP